MLEQLFELAVGIGHAAVVEARQGRRVGLRERGVAGFRSALPAHAMAMQESPLRPRIARSYRQPFALELAVAAPSREKKGSRRRKGEWTS